MMVLLGIVILVFVVVYIFDLILGMGVQFLFFWVLVNEGIFDIYIIVYQNFVVSLLCLWMVIFYIVVMIIIGLYIVQGVCNIINDFGGIGC